MKIDIICFSAKGLETGKKIKAALGVHEVSLGAKSKHVKDSIEESLYQWTERAFESSDCIIYIGSCGIAVRGIAPLVTSKKTDPAVLVVDELGKFTVSLLSGHLGGANKMAEMVATAIGSVPVITTGTDVNHKLAPDVFAKENNCIIHNMDGAKNLAAAIVNGDKVPLYTDMEIDGAIPSYIHVRPLSELIADGETKIVVSPFYRDYVDSENSLWLIPKVMVAGIGCRRGISEEKVAKAVMEAFAEEGIDSRSLKLGASIDLKADEEGILAYFRDIKVEIQFFSVEELMALDGEFTASNFVRSITGVDCVCERSAMAASHEGVLIKRKTMYDKVTVALSEEKGRLRFE